MSTQEIAREIPLIKALRLTPVANGILDNLGLISLHSLSRSHPAAGRYIEHSYLSRRRDRKLEYAAMFGALTFADSPMPVADLITVTHMKDNTTIMASLDPAPCSVALAVFRNGQRVAVLDLPLRPNMKRCLLRDIKVNVVATGKLLIVHVGSSVPYAISQQHLFFFCKRTLRKIRPATRRGGVCIDQAYSIFLHQNEEDEDDVLLHCIKSLGYVSQQDKTRDESSLFRVHPETGSLERHLTVNECGNIVSVLSVTSRHVAVCGNKLNMDLCRWWLFIVDRRDASTVVSCDHLDWDFRPAFVLTPAFAVSSWTRVGRGAFHIYNLASGKKVKAIKCDFRTDDTAVVVDRRSNIAVVAFLKHDEDHISLTGIHLFRIDLAADDVVGSRLLQTFFKADLACDLYCHDYDDICMNRISGLHLRRVGLNVADEESLSCPTACHRMAATALTGNLICLNLSPCTSQGPPNDVILVLMETRKESGGKGSLMVRSQRASELMTGGRRVSSPYQCFVAKALHNTVMVEADLEARTEGAEELARQWIIGERRRPRKSRPRRIPPEDGGLVQ